MAQGATIIDLQGRLARPSERRFERGERCGPYEIVRLMAAGGFGDVYEGVHHLLRRPVAIKILQDRHTNRDELGHRLEQEARVLSEIKNPHMVTVYDAGEQDGRIWMAMELLHGKTLREILEQGKPLPVSHALHHAACVANGVAAAHDLRVVHRDLKPENVFVTTEGHTIVLDLGTAKVLGDVKGRQTQRIIGTVAYMSPEHLLGSADGLPIDQRTDIYSLSLMLYEMLAGFHPYALARSTRTMPKWNDLVKKQLEELPEPLGDVAPWVPDYVYRIVRTGISKEREARQATMREFEIELRQAAKWFVEARAASERAPSARAASLDADTCPDPIPAFMSADTAPAPRPVRLLTERLDADAGAKRDNADQETRTAPGVKPPVPVPVESRPTAPARRAHPKKRTAVPLRVLLAPLAGAVIGLLIVGGMKVAKRHSAGASSAPLVAPTVSVAQIVPFDTPQPANAEPQVAAEATTVTPAKAEPEAKDQSTPPEPASGRKPSAKPSAAAAGDGKSVAGPINGDDDPFRPVFGPSSKTSKPTGKTRPVPVIDDDAPLIPAPPEPAKPKPTGKTRPVPVIDDDAPFIPAPPEPAKPKPQPKTKDKPVLPASGL